MSRSDLGCSPGQRRKVLALAFFLCLAGALTDPDSARAQDERTVPVDGDHRQAIIEKVVSELNANYIDPDEAARIDQALHRQLETGQYDRFDELTPFLKELRADMRQVVDDRHLGVWPIWYAPTAQDTSQAARQKWQEEMRLDHFGFRRLEIMPGNVGYLELTGFCKPEVGEDAAIAAMDFLAGVDALIIDLRENHGGSEHMVNLICAHLFPEPVHTITITTRYKNETLHLWTPDHIRGSALAEIPVYVLQSHESASAAEHLSYALQAVGRAVIVGERSRGAANPVEERIYPELSINISLPVSRAVHPVTGTDWEGTGVRPDVESPADEALKAAHRLALEKLGLEADGRW